MRIRPWFLLVALATGCGGYDAPSEVTFGSLAYTQQAPGATFTTLRTYYLDPVVEVWQDGVPQPGQPLPAAASATITTRMAAYGYTQVNTPPKASAAPNSDVGMRLAYLKTTQAYYVSSGYCSPYWVYWACWPSWAYAGSYTNGTVLVLMVNTRLTPPNTAVLWVAGLYGVLQGATLDSANFNNALNRAFDQSPYLKTSP
jgi:hypothetical protein